MGVITLKNSGQFNFKKVVAFCQLVSFDLNPLDKLKKFYQITFTTDE
jgi:hypothetical protein